MDQYNKISEGLSKIQSDVTKDLISVGYIVGIIIGVIGFVFLVTDIITLAKIRQIKNWAIIKNGATIIDSYMENTSSSTTYSILVISETHSNLLYRTRASFAYKIDNKSYLSNKVSYYEPWESNPAIAKVETDKLKKGNKVDVRVNPKNPSEAYIYNKTYNKYMRIMFCILLILIGIYLSW